MASLRTVLVLMLVKTVICEDSLLQPCERRDIDCLSRSTEQFLEKTHKGIQEYDIRPIDPLVVPVVSREADKDMGLWFHFTNVTVTGLKNQKISDFQMNTGTKSVVLKTKADLRMYGNGNTELKKQGKMFVGNYTYDASVIGTASYSYDIKKNAQGVEHFEVGPETITCETIAEPNVVLSKELSEGLGTSENDVNWAKIHKETVCAIVKQAYIDIIHNIRASAKILPKSAFFKDI